MGVSRKIELDKRHQKKDGTYPLKLRITIDRKIIRIPLGYSLPLSDWNEKTQSVRSSSKIVKNTTRLNAQLEAAKTNALDVIAQLIDSGEIKAMTPSEIKNRITGKKKKTKNVLALFDVIIAELELAKRVGYARVYKMVRGSISNFLNNRDVPLNAVTYKWLTKYEQWYLNRYTIGKDGKEKPNTLNGLAINLKTLRTLMNEAIKRNLLPQEAYPFKAYSIKKVETRKRAISQEDIQTIIAYVPQTSKQELAKDNF